MLNASTGVSHKYNQANKEFMNFESKNRMYVLWQKRSRKWKYEEKLQIRQRQNKEDMAGEMLWQGGDKWEKSDTPHVHLNAHPSINPHTQSE